MLALRVVPGVIIRRAAAPPLLLSSLRMVPAAAAVPMAVPALGLDSVTAKFSADSTVLSPATLTVMVLLVSPAAKLTVPVGNTPPAKSAAAAGLAPLPVTAKAAVEAAAVLPVRVTVKVNAVLPLLPSFRLAFAAAIDRVGEGGGPDVLYTAKALSLAFSTLPGDELPGPTWIDSEPSFTVTCWVMV